jgi:hypothetical protein
MTTDAQLLREQKAKALSRRDAMIIGMDGAGMSLKAIAMKLRELGYTLSLNQIGRVIAAERRANYRPAETIETAIDALEEKLGSPKQ